MNLRPKLWEKIQVSCMRVQNMDGRALQCKIKHSLLQCKIKHTSKLNWNFLILDFNSFLFNILLFLFKLQRDCTRKHEIAEQWAAFHRSAVFGAFAGNRKKRLQRTRSVFKLLLSAPFTNCYKLL